MEFNCMFHGNSQQRDTSLDDAIIVEAKKGIDISSLNLENSPLYQSEGKMSANMQLVELRRRVEERKELRNYERMFGWDFDDLEEETPGRKLTLGTSYGQRTKSQDDF